ncbi:MAG: type II secretion system protein [Victivallales bacterium]|nr:type II secretion system protein [Victivallales bacterium]
MRFFSDRQYRHRPFTLVEILTVITIICILMGIGLGVYGLAMGKAKRAKTETLLNKIEVALENFKTKYGYYPQSKGGPFYLDLSNMGLPAAEIDNQRTFFNKNIDYETVKNNSSVKYNGQDVLADAWEQPIYYQCPGAHNAGMFDLGSAGPDGKVGSNNAVFNLNGTPDFDSKNSDDIANY